MKILILDTCGATGSVVLADSEGEPTVLASACLPGRSASERLVVTIKDLMARIGLGLESLGLVAVVHGPGSFTGVRVGLSAAKGLCEALHLPLIAISRLAVLAHPAYSAGGRVLALLDAGRGEFYVGEYAGGIRLREALLTRDELLAAVDSGELPVIVACEAGVAESVAALSPRLVAEPTAEDALPLVLGRLQAGEFDSVATVDANYLRRTDAEIFAKPTASAHQPGTPRR